MATMPTELPHRAHGRRTPAAVAADVVCVLAFIAVGRRNHAEGVTLAGIADTAWPFLVGAAAGWLVSRGWRRPTAVVPTGLTVWLCTVSIGMLLRVISGQGTAPAFILVATIVTAVLLVGWRAAFGFARRAA